MYDLLNLPTEDLYFEEYKKIYCDRTRPICTHDGITVKFFEDKFKHAFYDSVITKDDTFSRERAERLTWIKDVLQDPSSLLLAGYDKAGNCYDHTNRVAVVKHDYVVIVWMKDKKNAKFITAFKATNSIRKILKSPPWVDPFL